MQVEVTRSHLIGDQGALLVDSKSLEQVIAARPTAEFDATYGASDHALFLPVIYAELAGRD